MGTILFPVIRDCELNLPYVLKGAACDFNIERLDRPQGLDAGWWLQTRSGSGRVTAGDLDQPVGTGQAVWITPGQPHELIADKRGWTVDWLSIGGQGLAQFIASGEPMARTSVIQLTDPVKFRDLADQILASRKDQSPSANRYRSSLAYSFLLEVDQQFAVNSSSSFAQREVRLLPVLDYISGHYRETIALTTLAQLLDVTPQHLCTMFRKFMGMRIFEYINLIRIQISKAELIAFQDKPVREIAHESGFDDVSYFCSIFKRFEKVTPGEFRKLFIR